MSIFNEFLPKLNEISKDYIKNINDDLKAVLQCFDKFEEEFKNEKNRARDKASKDKNLTTLQSIDEDEDESTKTLENEKPRRQSRNRSSKSTDEARSSLDSNGDRQGSKKRTKNEVDGILSPEQDKRQKRNASVKAQSIISKQVKESMKICDKNIITILDTPKRGVNVNLTQKMRREEPADSADKTRRRRKDEDKENTEPVPIVPLVQVKQEKVSLPSEPMDTEALPLNIELKQEVNKDEITMPPPVAPIPKSRRAVQKEKSDESTDDESGNGKRRTTRTRKQTDTMPPPPVAGARATRASSRAARPTDAREEPAPEAARPKRTRAKKKAESESSNADTEKENQVPKENGIASPAEKPRPKRTRKVQKAIESAKEDTQTPPGETDKPTTAATTTTTEPALLQPKAERVTVQETIHSPIIHTTAKIYKKPANKAMDDVDGQIKLDPTTNTTRTIEIHDSVPASSSALEETRVIPKDSTVVNGDMDQTVVLPNGVYNHNPVTPVSVRAMNETVVLEKVNRETMVLDKPQNAIMDATVVIEKDPKATDRLTDDNSLLTNDSDSLEPATPPKPPPHAQPTSAVKEKVQQFEEMASRVTRTKTRAMAKKQEEPTENQTPPDKIFKPVLSAETLNKMNSMIFNGKSLPQISSSATKPRAIPTPAPAKVSVSSARKLSERDHSEDREDARRKKEAMLKARREDNRRKREEKMAAAAAAREAAERERRAAAAAAARERTERQAHADRGRLERARDAERKKAELARKVAETEERRRCEEAARQQRLADEQRRADLARRRQLAEAEAMKKEAAIMAREIEKRQKEYIEKQKMKQRMEGDRMTPLRNIGTPGGLPLPPIEPVYMADGFQYLNSDEEYESTERQIPVPAWSTSKARRQQLCIQAALSAHHVDRLFSVRAHSPDLAAIFPGIERARLKRTSSAVWRTPPSRLPALSERD